MELYHKKGIVKERNERTRSSSTYLGLIQRLADYASCEKEVPEDTLLALELEAVQSDGEILTPKISSKEGWMRIEQIEREPAPYGSGNAHRYDYLKIPLIEKNKFRCIVKKKGQKNFSEAKPTVYRLKRDEITRKIIFDFFEDMGVLDKLTSTTYFQDTLNPELKEWFSHEEVIKVCLEYKRRYGHYPQLLEGTLAESLKFFADDAKASKKAKANIKNFSPKELKYIIKCRKCLGMPITNASLLTDVFIISFAEYLNKKSVGIAPTRSKPLGEVERLGSIHTPSGKKSRRNGGIDTTGTKPPGEVGAVGSIRRISKQKSQVKVRIAPNQPKPPAELVCVVAIRKNPHLIVFCMWIRVINFSHRGVYNDETGYILENRPTIRTTDGQAEELAGESA